VHWHYLVALQIREFNFISKAPIHYSN